MKKKNFKKLIILNIPYVLIGLVATNVGEAFRIAGGTNASEKVQSVVLDGCFGTAFANPLPSFHPIDLLVDIVNHKNISSLHLPYDFYNYNLFKSDCKTDSTKIHGSVGFAISADILTKAMRYYLPFVY